MRARNNYKEQASSKEPLPRSGLVFVNVSHVSLNIVHRWQIKIPTLVRISSSDDETAITVENSGESGKIIAGKLAKVCSNDRSFFVNHEGFVTQTDD